MLESQLCVLNSLRRVVTDHHPLRNAGESCTCIPGSIVAGSTLVRSVMRQSAAVRHLGEDHHRGASEQSFEIPLSSISNYPLALAHDDDWLARHPAICLGHR